MGYGCIPSSIQGTLQFWLQQWGLVHDKLMVKMLLAVHDIFTWPTVCAELVCNMQYSLTDRFLHGMVHVCTFGVTFCGAVLSHILITASQLFHIQQVHMKKLDHPTMSCIHPVRVTWMLICLIQKMCAREGRNLVDCWILGVGERLSWSRCLKHDMIATEERCRKVREMEYESDRE